jgi:hypothetical protein
MVRYTFPYYFLAVLKASFCEQKNPHTDLNKDQTQDTVKELHCFVPKPPSPLNSLSINMHFV